MFILTGLIVACGNNSKLNIPGKVDVVTSGETVHTIRHEIVVSVELKQAFKEECVQELGQDAPPSALEVCQAQKELEFVEQFLQLLNQQQPSGV